MKRLLLFLMTSAAFGAAPVVFFSDLTSGPKTGGENNKGVYVTIAGKNFGATRGTSYVSIGGGQADNYPIWSDTKICLQVGANAATGNITVTTSAGTSNGVAFTVRSGNIYFVAPGGSDGAAGSFAAPWLTLGKASSTWAAGDTIYVRDGFSMTADDGRGANASLFLGLGYDAPGTAGNPVALVAYPGATVTIGGGASFGIRNGDSYLTLSGLTLRAAANGFALETDNASHVRLAFNDVLSTNTNSQSGCLTATRGTDIVIVGNNIHGCGSATSDKQDHTVYFGTDLHDSVLAWNLIHDNLACYGIQVHSSPLTPPSGYSNYGISIHDNLFYNQTCSAINLATINPSGGAVEVYNNVIYNVGYQAATDGGSRACIFSPGYTNYGTPGSGTANIFNNTFYDCGDAVFDIWHSSSTTYTIVFTNNIIQVIDAIPYLSANTIDSVIAGSYNVWYGNGNGPTTNFTNNINSNPLMVDPVTARDFHLQSGSSAKDAGTSSKASAADYDGVIRPQNTVIDIGAYEYITGGSPPVKQRTRLVTF